MMIMLSLCIFITNNENKATGTKLVFLILGDFFLTGLT